MLFVTYLWGDRRTLPHLLYLVSFVVHFNIDCIVWSALQLDASELDDEIFSLTRTQLGNVFKYLKVSTFSNFIFMLVSREH